MANADYESEKLAKRIEPHHLFTIGFGTIVGVGWMIVAGGWLADAGAVGATIAFAIGGFVMLLIALCYAELGMLYPQSGGEVVYLYESFGPFTAYVAGWLLTLIYVSITAFEAIATAWIIDVLVPGFGGPRLYTLAGSDVHLNALLLGLAGMAGLCYANFRGGGTVARLQDLLTLVFAGASILFILSGIAGGSLQNAQPLIRPGASGWMLGGIIAVLVTVPVWYGGFNAVPQALGEVVDVKKRGILVRGLGFALLSAGIFYVGVIFATAMAAPPGALSSAELPVAAALFNLFESPWPGRLVLIAGLLGIVTSWNAMFFSAARVLFALSRARIVPLAFSRVHARFGSPGFAVVFVGVVGGIGVFAGRGMVEPIINTVGICLSTVYVFVCLGLLRLRRTQGDLPRPYEVPGFPWLPRIAMACATLILALALVQPWLNSDLLVPLEWRILASWGLLGAIVWRAAKPLRESITEAERRRHIHVR